MIIITMIMPKNIQSKRRKSRKISSNYFSFRYRWMNPKHNPYQPTLLEHKANVLTHAIAILPSVYGAHSLVKYANTHEQHRSVLIYGFSLILLFTISTLFHLFSLITHLRYMFRVYFCSLQTPNLFKH